MASVILIGFMGAGKSTVGQRLGEKLNQPFIDLDETIVAEIGMPIADYFSAHGEADFRTIESRSLMQNSGEARVIATGGGIVMNEKNRVLLAKLPNVFYLSAPFSELLSRIQNDKKNIRPIAQNNSDNELQNLHNFRHPLYLNAANFEISTAQKSIDDIVAEILEKVKQS